jgi:hypothetical protein
MESSTANNEDIEYDFDLIVTLQDGTSATVGAMLNDDGTIQFDENASPLVTEAVNKLMNGKSISNAILDNRSNDSVSIKSFTFTDSLSPDGETSLEIKAIIKE